jgi:hypothetical protein
LRTGKRIASLFSLFFAFALTHAQADSGSSPSLQAPNEALGENELGIVNLSDQDLSPELRDCIKKKTLGECLQKSLQAHSPKLLADDVDQDMVGLWRSFLQSQLTPGSSLLSTQPAGIYFGLNLNGTVIDMDEIASDPNKIATDQKLGNRALWVKHDLELLPQVGAGFNAQHFPAVLENATSYFGGAVTASAVLRITKRHPMDDFYNKNFWGYLHQDLHLAGQALPMYLKVLGPGQDLLPGEGIEIERYGSIALGVGPAANVTGFPSAINTIGAGVFVSAQFVVTVERGHFRTTMEVQTDGTLHVTLNRINQDSEKLETELSAGAGLGPLSYVLSLIRLETGVTHTTENLLDLVFDPKYPEAQKALSQAYFGFFTDAQKLAASADSSYKGVRSLARTSLSETAHEKDFQFFFYDKGSTESETTASTSTPAAQMGAPEPASDESDIMDNMTDHRSTTDSNRSVDITLDTDLKNPDPKTNRSMSLKYKFASNDAKPDEVISFLKLAQTFASADSQPEINRWLEKIQTDSSGEKRGHFEAYFYAGLDPKDVSDLMQNPDQKVSAWTVSWARSLGFPNPEAWASMTEKEQKSAAKKIQGGKAHLKAYQKFVQAIRQAAADQTELKQSQHFVKEIRGIDFDLYPVLALIQPEDRSNLSTMERLTLGENPASEDAFQYSAIGDNYTFPKRTEY